MFYFFVFIIFFYVYKRDLARLIHADSAVHLSLITALQCFNRYSKSMMNWECQYIDSRFLVRLINSIRSILAKRFRIFSRG